MNLAHLKDAMSRFVTGVAVVTTRFEGVDYGMTCNSFNTVSLDPALVMWSIRKTSSSYAAFTQSAGYVVNLLAAHQTDVAMGFTQGSHAARFAPLIEQRAPSGIRTVAETAAWFDCTLFQTVSAGDHDILIGQITSTHAADVPALAYARRQFGVLTPVTEKA
jgi:3-hydroxy-9,10-secoandrosta-1,3,5(10)-triene-9,17-dione monooxygenase reductase component